MKEGHSTMDAPFRKGASADAIATEVASLGWLAAATPGGGAPVAQLLDHGSDWLTTRMLRVVEPSRADAGAFGRRLALTHAAGAAWLGVPPPGLPVSSAVLAELPSPAVAEPLYTSWGAFFAELRLEPYLAMARDRGTVEHSDATILSRCVERIARGDFDAPQPEAVRQRHIDAKKPGMAVARIHGDLWGGNVVWADGQRGATGTLIDPSAHGGHAETDLAELAVFGSPWLSDTIAGYQEASPLTNGWEERVPVHQLHMLLVHVVLFGGSYVARSLEVARRVS